jgi:hypothetical protein
MLAKPLRWKAEEEGSERRDGVSAPFFRRDVERGPFSESEGGVLVPDEENRPLPEVPLPLARPRGVRAGECGGSGERVK